MSDQRQSGKQAAQNLYSLNVSGYTARCFLPKDGKTDRIVYMHAAMPDEADKVWQLLSCQCVLVCIDGIEWNRDMSPWYHSGVFAKGGDFAGGANLYLQKLCNEIIPGIEERINSDIMVEYKGEVHRYLAGYSLSGLFSLYALYHTDLFEGIACMSGSLWYEGWIPYMKKHEMCRKPEKIYFSLGDQEAKGNSQMRTVTERTEETKRYMEDLGISTILEWNPGNHFRDVPERIARGIDWLMTDAE